MILCSQGTEKTGRLKNYTEADYFGQFKEILRKKKFKVSINLLNLCKSFKII
jgi:hypothetical protein